MAAPGPHTQAGPALSEQQAVSHPGAASASNSEPSLSGWEASETDCRKAPGTLKLVGPPGYESESESLRLAVMSLTSCSPQKKLITIMEENYIFMGAPSMIFAVCPSVCPSHCTSTLYRDDRSEGRRLSARSRL